jgi:hypothetical protein
MPNAKERYNERREVITYMKQGEQKKTAVKLEQIETLAE